MLQPPLLLHALPPCAEELLAQVAACPGPSLAGATTPEAVRLYGDAVQAVQTSAPVASAAVSLTAAQPAVSSKQRSSGATPVFNITAFATSAS